MLLAQNDIQANVNLQFRFTNPGARAQAMGGAFIGLADDTTAIFANPAGLTQLSASTIAFETNNQKQDNEIPFYGGSIDQVGLQDFQFNLESREFPDDRTDVPFVGYVNAKNRLKWGVFYASLSNFERQFDTTGVAIPSFERDVAASAVTFFQPSDNRLELRLRTLGISVAGKITDRLSAGATLLYYDFEHTANTTLYFPDLEQLFPNENFPQALLDALEPLIGTATGVVDVDGDDAQIGYYAGLLYAPTDRFSLGMAWRAQPEFDYDYNISVPDSAMVLTSVESGEGIFNVPDSFGGGISFKPNENFILSVEVNRVIWSELSDDYIRFFEEAADPSNATQTARDATEYRIGAEYFILSARFPLALRLGYWLDPYHALQNTLNDTQLLFRFVDANDDFVQAVRPAAFLQQFEQDENHITFGFGLTLSNSFVLDFAGDISETTRNITLSGVYRF